MTPEERREGGTRLCQRLAREVAELVPEGIGGWDRAWTIVSSADSTFLLALAKWEGTGAESDKPPLREAYRNVIRAWKRAVEEYEREGVGR